MISRFAVAASLAIALAACGSQSEPTAAPSAEATPTETASAGPEAMPSASETPAATESATPTPSPTPTPTAATPKPTASATVAAAASPPDAFKQCSVCHSTEPGKTIIGPSLAGIYGTKAGEVHGYDFSDAMEHSGLTWNAANLDKFLTDPKGTVPGTTMGFAGLKDADKRAAIIAYLKSL